MLKKRLIKSNSFSKYMAIVNIYIENKEKQTFNSEMLQLCLITGMLSIIVIIQCSVCSSMFSKVK